MIRNIFKILIGVLTLITLLIGYFAYFGFTTTKFNSIIKSLELSILNNLLQLIGRFFYHAKYIFVQKDFHI